VTLMLAVALVSAGGGVVAYETDAFRSLDLHSIDSRFDIRGESPKPATVAVVAIDTTTFNDIPDQQWPYPRSWHGEAIRILKKAGAKVIAYDVQFTEPTTPKEDNALIVAARKAGNVVFGTSEIAPGGKTRIFGGGPAIDYARALPASVEYPLDPSGVIRRIAYETDGLETMPVVAYKKAFHRVPNPKRFLPDGAWIDYNGGPGSVATVSFSRLLLGKFPKGIFKGRIVVVGASAQSLQDLHPTSTTEDEEMPGPEIQAHAIDTLIRGIPLTVVPAGLDLLLILGLALLAPLIGLRFGALVTVAASLLATAGFLYSAQTAFDRGHIITVVYPLASSIVSTLGVVGVHYVTEVRERRRTRTAFSRFVPAAVVDRVLEQAEDGLRLGGEEVLGTVLLSDIRGFTTFSENNPAPVVLEILNNYLEEMTSAIMGHGGTLIGYLGDGIIAVFGAPLEQPDHADRAIAAAQEMLGPRLEKFNAWMLEQGVEEPFAMGVGINSGLFMAGNVGSTDRLEYTIIGDTVNTAARMEALTKGSGHSLFIAESTRFMLVGEPPELEFVGDYAIRGREGKMKIWAPARADAPPESDGGGVVAERARTQASGVYEIMAEAEPEITAESP
jgi:adenylate cyclase